MNRTNTRHIAVSSIVALILAGLFSIAPTQAAITPQGQRGCAPGTVVGGANKVINGDFAISPGPAGSIAAEAGFTSGIPNRGSGIYPDDSNGGGFSIQTGSVSYIDKQIVGRAFPGDEQRDIAPSATYFYSNPQYSSGQTEVLLWRQDIAVAAGTTYNFFAYFDNLLVAGTPGENPLIELRVDGIAAGPPIAVPALPDVWIPIQYAFTTATNQTSATLEVYDLAANIVGDDFGMTQINLKQCVAGMGVALSTFLPIDNHDGSYDVSFIITVRNYGVDPEPIRNLQIMSDLMSTLGSIGSFQVITIQSADLTVNQGFNGSSDIRLLSGTDTLPASTAKSLTFTVRLRPHPGTSLNSPVYITVRATGISGNVEISDNSTPGTNPDPNDNGDSKEPGENLPTPVYLTPLQFYLPLIRR